MSGVASPFPLISSRFAEGYVYFLLTVFVSVNNRSHAMLAEQELT